MNAVLDKYSTSHRRALIDQMPTYTPAADAPLTEPEGRVVVGVYLRKVCIRPAPPHHL